jgi:hypothetical protein
MEVHSVGSWIDRLLCMLTCCSDMSHSGLVLRCPPSRLHALLQLHCLDVLVRRRGCCMPLLWCLPSLAEPWDPCYGSQVLGHLHLGHALVQLQPNSRPGQALALQKPLVMVLLCILEFHAGSCRPDMLRQPC